MTAGEKYTFDIEQFKSYEINYAKYELTSSNETVITVKKNISTVVENESAMKMVPPQFAD